jgi:hypothetical protein
MWSMYGRNGGAEALIRNPVCYVNEKKLPVMSLVLCGKLHLCEYKLMLRLIALLFCLHYTNWSASP